MRTRIAAEVLGWAALCCGLWCVFVGSITAPEVLAGVAAGLLAGGGAGHLRVIGWPGFAPRLRWLRWLPGIALTAVADTGRLVALLARAARRRDGAAAAGLRTVPLVLTRDGARADAHRALAAMAVSATPGAVVVDLYDDGDARVHALAGAGDSLAREVAP